MFIIQENGLTIACIESTWTGEWDLRGDNIHYKDACTISTREEAYKRVKEFCNKNPEFKFLVFDTPGGVRAICISHRYEPNSWESYRLHSKLDCDPLYQELTYKSKMYCLRVSPKAKRVKETGHDYISRKKYVMGTGNIDSHCLKESELYYKEVEKNRV